MELLNRLDLVVMVDFSLPLSHSCQVLFLCGTDLTPDDVESGSLSAPEGLNSVSEAFFFFLNPFSEVFIIHCSVIVVGLLRNGRSL